MVNAFLAFQFFSLLASACSGFVVLSGLIFSVMLSPTRPFSHIIFFISLSDMIGSIGNSLGFPNSGTFLCYTQSILIQFFFPASWFWTIALVFQIYCMVFHNRLWIQLHHIHGICWLLPAILTLAPLATNVYGHSASNGHGLCHLGGNNVFDIGVWFEFIFVYLLLFVLTIISGLVGYMVLSQKYKELDDRRKSIIKTTAWYPLAMFISWFPKVIFGLIESASKTLRLSNSFNETVDIITTFYGILVAVIFLLNSERLRTHWYNLIKKRKYIFNLENDEQYNDDEEIEDEDSLLTTMQSSAGGSNQTIVSIALRSSATFKSNRGTSFNSERRSEFKLSTHSSVNGNNINELSENNQSNNNDNNNYNNNYGTTNDDTINEIHVVNVNHKNNFNDEETKSAH
eukprot:gene14463-19411_t